MTKHFSLAALLLATSFICCAQNAGASTGSDTTTHRMLGLEIPDTTDHNVYSFPLKDYSFLQALVINGTSDVTIDSIELTGRVKLDEGEVTSDFSALQALAKRITNITLTIGARIYDLPEMPYNGGRDFAQIQIILGQKLRGSGVMPITITADMASRTKTVLKLYFSVRVYATDIKSGERMLLRGDGRPMVFPPQSSSHKSGGARSVHNTSSPSTGNKTAAKTVK